MKNSIWHDVLQHPCPSWPTLESRIAADVAIIGAGITGLSCAWHLLNAGLKVVVLEANEVGSGTTGASTGNLYVPVGARLHTIEKKHSSEVLSSVVAARTAALNFIEARVREDGIACEFQRVPFHFFTSPDNEAGNEVRAELATARHLGLPVSDTGTEHFPFQTAALMTLPEQAQLNPLQYVLGLAECVTRKGCHLYENSRVLEAVDGEPCTVSTAAGQVTARHIVKATHVPQGLYAVHAAMLPHREYAVLARVKNRQLPPGIYWNANSAWRYSVRPLQFAQSHFVLAVGEPHKPGEPKPGQMMKIVRFLRRYFPVIEVTHTWSAQSYQPADLLPYIGTSPMEKHTWMATGFGGDGLVWGTTAGEIISDGIREVESRAAGTFAPKRFTPVASAANVVKESAAVTKHLLQDMVAYGNVAECDALAPGEGCVVKFKGEKVAACRDSEGQLHVVSAVCTHLGCLVHWNPLELSWDCPCHGSRFSMQGRVLEGPAQDDLPLARKRVKA